MIDKETVGRRLDQYLSEREDASRSAVQKWIEDGLVTVNGKTVSKSYKLSAGDEVAFTRPEAVPMEAKAENNSFLSLTFCVEVSCNRFFFECLIVAFPLTSFSTCPPNAI